MQPILLKPLFHRGKEQVGIFFETDKELNNQVRKINQIKWSQTHKCWYLPLSPSSYTLIKDKLKQTADLDSTPSQAYLKKRQLVKNSVVASDKQTTSKQIVSSPAWKLCKENLQALAEFYSAAKIKRV